MSRNRKYIEQFDRSAGKPADFDSLFRFDKNELIAKRKIKMTGRSSRLAAMCSVAAVIGIAVFAALAYINTKGIESDTVLSKSTGNVSPELTEFIEENSRVEMLSAFTDRFDYYISGDDVLSSDTSAYRSNIVEESDISVNWQWILRFNAVSKKYDGSNIIYTLKPLEGYVDDSFLLDIESSDDQTLTVSVPALMTVGELQTGREYIMPLFVYRSDDDGILHTDYPTDFFAVKTESGWLIYDGGTYYSKFFDELEADTLEIYNDMNANGKYFLEPSDEAMNAKIKSYADRADYTYYYQENGIEVTRTALSDIMPSADFEKVRYGTTASGGTDKTLLVLDNEQYFSFVPYISGVVAFAGKTVNGELCAAVELENSKGLGDVPYCRTVIISGFSELYVSTGESLDGGTAIGMCSSEPLYMRLIDSSGMPMETDISNFTDETTVMLSE